MLNTVLGINSVKLSVSASLQNEVKESQLVICPKNCNSVLSFNQARALKAIMLTKITFSGIQPGLFKKVSANENNPNWDKLINRKAAIYKKPDDIRTEFERDYDRILHSDAYSKLKQKTQVFSASNNGLNCSRIEHVNQVAAISERIAKVLGLNVELTRAIAIGHDLGHSPFGHSGEKVLKEIAKNNINKTFWHEKNGLRFVDMVETLPDTNGREKNLNLTYAVRDGIICHCGEVDQNVLMPRKELIDLDMIDKPGQYEPGTWEGCVVKISDKIAYLGRDIEDALSNNVLSPEKKKDLVKQAEECLGTKIADLNNSMLIHNFITDLCTNSSPEKGICFSEKYLKLMKMVKDFNYENIYKQPRLQIQSKYSELVINSIFDTLKGFHEGADTLAKLEKAKESHPLLIFEFEKWLTKYSDLNPTERQDNKYDNKVIYSIQNKDDYIQAVIDFISGMTDNFAIKSFNEILTF